MDEGTLCDKMTNISRPQNMPPESPRDSQKQTKYVQIRLKSVPKPRYTTAKLICYGSGLTSDRVEEILKEKLKGVKL